MVYRLPEPRRRGERDGCPDVVRHRRLLHLCALPRVRIIQARLQGLGGKGPAGRCDAAPDAVQPGQRLLRVQPGGQLGLQPLGRHIPRCAREDPREGGDLLRGGGGQRRGGARPAGGGKGRGSGGGDDVILGGDWGRPAEGLVRILRRDVRQVQRRVRHHTRACPCLRLPDQQPPLQQPVVRSHRYGDWGALRGARGGGA
mmetsp:Transcript_13701/g.30208  ORF Transcript_13701/g.30208 Transcript_13701/m.30208 type:complete len:200 (-) Transcript_13701:264-863(-)